MAKTISKNIHLAVALLGLIFLAALTYWHRQPPLFDEPFFIANVRLFLREGLTRDFLVNLQDQAPGPLYEFVHYAFYPLTNLETPGVRLVNVFLLTLIIVLLSAILVQLRNTRFSSNLVYAASIVAVPMIWQVSGMALTEMPAMFFSVASLLFLILALKKEPTSALASTLLAALAGFCLGMAILGRSPFLLLAPAALIWLPGETRNAARWRTVLIYILVALGLSLPVFYIWGGLVPPQQAFVGRGFSLWHFILGFSYASFMALIIGPKWFYFNKKVLLLLAGGYVVFLLINIYITKYVYAPLDGTLEHVFPKSFMGIFHLLISPFLALIAVYFLICTGIQAWAHRRDRLFLFILACTMALLLSCGKVTHLFSTRYVAQAAPFFLLLLPQYDRFSWWKVLRFLLGMAIGFLSLETYFGFR